MITFAIYNLKGGVGKTASAVNLSYLASREGRSTLLWDLDPQASATYYYQVQPKDNGKIKDVIRGKDDLQDHIRITTYEGLKVLPADFSGRKLDVILNDMKKSELENLLEPMAKEFDAIFIDSPPALSHLAENIFHASDYILMPMIPTVLSIRSYTMVVKFFEKHELRPERILAFFTMVDMRKDIHRDTIQEFTAHDKNFLKAYIPYASVIEKMGLHRAPLLSYDTRSAAAASYVNLWNEIKKKVKKESLADSKV
jgi:chromosome partitioning protein